MEVPRGVATAAVGCQSPAGEHGQRQPALFAAVTLDHLLSMPAPRPVPRSTGRWWGSPAGGRRVESARGLSGPAQALAMGESPLHATGGSDGLVAAVVTLPGPAPEPEAGGGACPPRALRPAPADGDAEL